MRDNNSYTPFMFCLSVKMEGVCCAVELLKYVSLGSVAIVSIVFVWVPFVYLICKAF